MQMHNNLHRCVNYCQKCQLQVLYGGTGENIVNPNNYIFILLLIRHVCIMKCMVYKLHGLFMLASSGKRRRFTTADKLQATGATTSAAEPSR